MRALYLTQVLRYPLSFHFCYHPEILNLRTVVSPSFGEFFQKIIKAPMITEVSFRSTAKKPKEDQSPVNQFPSAATATDHVALVTYLARDLQQSLQTNRQNTAQVTSELHQVQRAIESTLEEIETIVSQRIAPLWETLKSGRQNQLEENEQMQQQVTGIKKEKEILRQMIFRSHSRAKELGVDIGLQQ